MATDLGQAKAAPSAKYDAFVQAQLARTEQRIRGLDLTAALLGFAAGTLAFAVAMALLDRWLELSPGVRQGALVVYLLAAAAYLTAFVVLPLSRRINPYFTARQLERTLPGAKNSVVNWLDLHQEDLPPAIRGAVGQRAARDVAEADVEKAVSGRRAWTAGGVAALCAVAFLAALFGLGFGSFFGSLGRAFAPFAGPGKPDAATATHITVVKPDGGDANVFEMRPVEILVRVDGRTPDPRAADALKLLFRYDPAAPYLQRPLEPDEGGRWGITLPAADVQDGFWYKVTGGDAETPEYRVRLTPRLETFKAVYHFRPYTARANETRTDRKIEALRGTQVAVTVHTNRDVKDGWLQFADGGIARGERLHDDAQGFTVRLTLDESNQYRIAFTSTEGETFTEPQPSPLIAVPDKPPVATLTQPAELKDTPGWVAPWHADDVPLLQGNATDDVGVKAMRLNVRVENGPELPPQEYRTPKDYQLAHGGNPTAVEYKDFVDLAKMKAQGDPLFAVHPGMVLEYWLTAEDACDYPDPNKPNVGESKHYHVQIIEPLKNEQANQQQRKDVQQQKQDAEQQQDNQQQKEDEKRQAENQQRQQSDQPKGQPNDGKPPEGNHQPEGDNQPKPGETSKPGTGDMNPDKPDHPNQPNPSNSGAGENGHQQQPDPAKAEKDKKDLENQIKKASDQIRKNEEAAGKPDAHQQQGEGKDAGPPQEQLKPGEAKDGAGKQAPQEKAEPKAGPQDKPGEQHEASGAKDQGNPDMKQPQQGEAKPGGDANMQPHAQPGQDKDGKTEAAPQPAQNKEGGPPANQAQAAADKPQDGMNGDQAPRAEGKERSSQATPQAQPSGDGKDKTAAEAKSEAKGAGPDNANQDAAKSGAKAEATPNPMDDPKHGTAKNAGDKPPDKQDVAAHKSDGSEGEPPPDAEQQQKQALENFMKKLKEDLKSDDPKRQYAAEEFLRRYMMRAEDPEVRDEAKKALKDAGLNPDEGNQLAANKPQERPNAAGAPPPPKREQPADGHDVTGKGESGAAKDNPSDDSKRQVKPGEPKDDGQSGMGEAVTRTPGNQPATAKGVPGKRDVDQVRQPQPPHPDAPPPTPETPLAQRASVLQLRDFYEAVPKDILKDAMQDPEKLSVLEDALRNYVSKQPNGKEDLPGPQQGGPLGSTVGKFGSPGDRNAPDDPNNGGRALPPPEYRNPAKEFNQLISPGGAKDNK